MTNTYSEAYRAACEAHHVIAIPTLAGRRAYLATVEARRGKAGRAALEEAITIEWQRRKKSA